MVPGFLSRGSVGFYSQYSFAFYAVNWFSDHGDYAR
jgi:hypothetical protein